MSNQDPLRQTIEELEEKILAQIATQVKAGKMSAPRAAEVSQMTLQCIDHELSFAGLHIALPKLLRTAPELEQAVTPMIKNFNDQLTRTVLQTVHNHLEQGNIETAHTIVKQVLQGGQHD